MEWTVGVLVAATLPRTRGIAKIDIHVGRDAERDVPRHLGTLIPGQRSSERGGKLGDGFHEAISHRFGRVVVGQVNEGNKPAGPLNKSPDR
ncbi:hypothetical protein GCM10009655_04100 [Rhodoglobus aureus]|uniref:Uncharacterized protein n=1 Tax=Rhodoglobus aureus TaxID=191497 RepID=A0ABN1VHL0_9MICO